MRSFASLSLATLALAGQAAALNITFGNPAKNITASTIIDVPDGILKTACQSRCDPAISAIKTCGDFGDECLCATNTTTPLVDCEQCMLEELIRKREKMPSPLAGSNPLLAAYTAACTAFNKDLKPSKEFQAIALTPPPDWDGPKVIILDTPATVVTVGFGSILGVGALLLLSNI